MRLPGTQRRDLQLRLQSWEVADAGRDGGEGGDSETMDYLSLSDV